MSAQLPLLSDAELPDPAAMLPVRRLAEHTAVGLRTRSPDVYAAIVRLRAEGMRVSLVARRLGVSRHTVYAVDRCESDTMTAAQIKDGAARRMRSMALSAFERADEIVAEIETEGCRPDQMSTIARNLAIIGAVAVDKSQLLAGDVTWRGEIVGEARPPTATEMSDYLAALPCIDETGTGLGGGSGGQKEGAETPGVGAEKGGREGGTDSESSARMRICGGIGRGDVSGGASEGTGEDGGGGDRARAGGGSST